jgi:hypothetical protein
VIVGIFGHFVEDVKAGPCTLGTSRFTHVLAN